MKVYLSLVSIFYPCFKIAFIAGAYMNAGSSSAASREQVLSLTHKIRQDQRTFQTKVVLNKVGHMLVYI
jgi:hypothetical protein